MRRTFVDLGDLSQEDSQAAIEYLNADPRFTAQLAGPTEIGNLMGTLIPGVISPTPPTASPPPPVVVIQAGEAPKKAASPDGNAPQGGAAAKADPKKTEEKKGAEELAPPVATIKEGLAALKDPSGAWDRLSKPDAARLAAEAIDSLRKDRSQYARRVAWTFAPEMELLDRAPRGQREQLAQSMLEVRTEIGAQDVEMAKAKVAIESKKPAFEEARANLAVKAVDLAGETVEQMKKWRELADLGIAIVCATTLFSMLAIAYMLLFLIPRNHLSGEVTALVIFTLAVFAASPSALLLLQRPLKGIDQWMPGGKASDDGGGDDGKGDAKGSQGGDSAGKASGGS